MILGALKQRNIEDEKRALREGRIPEDWAKKLTKLRQKDRDARWTVKYAKAKPAADGAKRVDIAVLMFCYKNHLGIDRRHWLIRTWTATDAITARSCYTCWIGPITRPRSGLTRPIGRRKTRRIS